MIGSIITAIASAGGEARARLAERDDEDRVDEQAGDDRGQRGHRLDDGAHDPGEPAADLGHEDRGADAERQRDRHARCRARCSEPTIACRIAALVEAVLGADAAHVLGEEVEVRERLASRARTTKTIALTTRGHHDQRRAGHRPTRRPGP